MDNKQFDDAVRRLARSLSRRGLTLGLTGVGITTAIGGLLVTDEGEAATKKCKKKKRKRDFLFEGASSCKKKKKKAVSPPPPPPPLPPAPPPPPHSPPIVCGADQEACGGVCVSRCPAPAVLNPVSCQCCLPTGVSCGPLEPVAPCCFAISNACVANVCTGAPAGAPCQFSGGCRPGLNCVNNVCTA